MMKADCSESSNSENNTIESNVREEDMHLNDRPAVGIQKDFFRAQIVLIALMTVILTISGLSLNLMNERKQLDLNLKNVAESIAKSQVVQESLQKHPGEAVLMAYLDSLKKSLADIDVISVIGRDQQRYYHSNAELVGTVYDGTVPDFTERQMYASDDRGPSGKQRRAYAAIYDEKGQYQGFVLAVMLRQNITRMTVRMLCLYLMVAAGAVVVALIFSHRLSGGIKKKLLGYEPDTFGAMFKIRENTLEALEEGILAIDNQEKILFFNHAAAHMLDLNQQEVIGQKLNEAYPSSTFARVLHTGKKEMNVRINSSKNQEILADQIPIRQNGEIVGAVAVFRNRTEYTRLMEDLTGVRFLVDSMRANNHDFTNKLHVILGLIQMGRSEEAVRYIMNITMVESKTIHSIMSAIEDASVAALLIGKLARASELDVHFSLAGGSHMSRSDVNIPSGTLVTIIGNLLDNAMEAMNHADTETRELQIGIFSQPQALLITVDDTGSGIAPENLERIFENGFSTKGSGRGTGMYQVKQLVETNGGTISVESEPGNGTSFSVSFHDTASEMAKR